MLHTPDTSDRTIEKGTFIPAAKLSIYKEAFQKIIDTLEPAETWRIAYTKFANAWNATTQGMILPTTSKGRNSVFNRYDIRPLTQEALETKLGGIKLNVKPRDGESDEVLGIHAIDSKKLVGV